LYRAWSGGIGPLPGALNNVVLQCLTLLVGSSDL